MEAFRVFSLSYLEDFWSAFVGNKSLHGRSIGGINLLLTKMSARGKKKRFRNFVLDEWYSCTLSLEVG